MKKRIGQQLREVDLPPWHMQLVVICSTYTIMELLRTPPPSFNRDIVFIMQQRGFHESVNS
jgi:hypothetical protein